MKRVHIWVSGRVQGIFFRANTRRKAMDLGLKGWVKNLEDGRVEAVIEGKDSDVKKMLEFMQKGPFGARVTKFNAKEEKYKGEFEFFEIKY